MKYFLSLIILSIISLTSCTYNSGYYAETAYSQPPRIEHERDPSTIISTMPAEDANPTNARK